MKKLVKCAVEMMVVMFVIIALTPAGSVAAKEKRIKIKSFPDKYLREELQKSDKNSDGFLNQKELRKVTSMDLESDSAPINLKGIGKLKYLKKFNISNCCPQNVINVKEIYKLYNLESLSLSSCEFKGKLKLNLKSLKKLKELTLYSGDIKSVKISKNKNLESLILAENISDIDLTKNKKLKYLSICGNKKMRKVNLKKNVKIQELELFSIESKYSLKFNKELKRLYVDKTKLPDISKNAKLKSLNCFYAENERISINKGNRSLENVDICLGNKAVKFSIKGCKKLKKLELWGSGKLDEVKISNCGKIKAFTLCDCTVDKYESDVTQYIQIYRASILGNYYNNKKIAITKEDINNYNQTITMPGN